MLKTPTKFAIALACVAALGACKSTPKDKAQKMEGMNYASWVTNPKVEGGLAVAECVLSSGNFSIDRQQAVSNATAALARQISVKVESLTTSLVQKSTENTGVNSASEFRSKTKTVVSQTMVGVTPQKVDWADLDGKRHLCALVSVDKSNTQQLFDRLIDNWSRPVSPDNKEQMYKAFLLKEAEKSLNSM